MDVPARATKPGAQRCVIQRVKKSAGQEAVGSVGLTVALEKKSRVWSSAMMIMSMPRTRSTVAMRRLRVAELVASSLAVAIMVYQCAIEILRQRSDEMAATGNSATSHGDAFSRPRTTC